VNEQKWPVKELLNVLGHFIQHDAGIRNDWDITESKMWGSFWANAGNKKCSHLQPTQKALLIYRTVFSTVLWKLSRWPFQKSIAEELDASQCQMLALVLPCVRAQVEDLDTYYRRRARQARNVASKCGMWSISWCDRLVSWHEHLKRAGAYQHPCTKLLKLHDSNWLMFQRSLWVSERDSRNSVLAGRTGTRLNIGRPQVRWQDGLSVAESVRKSRGVSIKGNNALSISSRIRESLNELRSSASQFMR